MAFDVYPQPPTAPFEVAGGATSAPIEFRELAGLDPATGTTRMFIRFAMSGDGDTPPGPPAPAIRLQAGAGTLVTLAGSSLTPIRDGSPGGQPVALASISGAGDGVQAVEVEMLRNGSLWRIQFGNPAPAARRFTWVVADTAAQTEQPWIDVPAELALEVEATGEVVTSPLTITNRGPGVLRLDGSDGMALGPGLVLVSTPDVVEPATRDQALVSFTGAATPGTHTLDHTVSSNDTTATPSTGHNPRVRLSATTRHRPLWRAGDVLVLDPVLGGLIRVDADDGTQTRVGSTELFRWPVGSAVLPDRSLVVADREAFSPTMGAARGGLIRVDRLTGRQEALSVGGLLENPSRVAVLPGADLLVLDGARVLRVSASGATAVPVPTENLLVTPQGIAAEDAQHALVVDGSAFDRTGGVIRMNLETGEQCQVTSGGELRRPVGLAREANGAILVVDRDLPGVIRIDAGQDTQRALAVGGLLRDPVTLAVAAGGDILVTDLAAAGGFGGVVVVDPVTGGQRMLSSGNVFQRPFGIVVA